MGTGFIAEERMLALREDLMSEAENVPHLSERTLVDLVNGLEVNDGLLRFKKSQGLISRVLGAIDGSNRTREAIIQCNQQQMTRGLLDWVEELTQSQTITNRALTETRRRLERTRADLDSIAEHSMRNRELLYEHATRLDLLARTLDDVVIPRLEHLEDFKRISTKRSAWVAGRLYQGYSLPVQAAFFIDDVARGEYGERIFKDEDLRAYLQDEALCALRELGFGTLIEVSRLIELATCSDAGRSRIANALLDLGDGAPLHQLLALAASGQAARDRVERVKKRGHVHPYYDGQVFVGHLSRETVAPVREN